MRETLRKDLFDAAYDRLGLPQLDEIYGFVPALALGGEETPASLQRLEVDLCCDRACPERSR